MKLNTFTIFSIFIGVLLVHLYLGILYSGYSWSMIAVVLISYIIIVGLGCYSIQWNFFLIAKNRLPFVQITFQEGKIGMHQNSKTVALTFDDGPNDDTHIILDILKKEQVKATFFLIGKNIEEHPEIAKRIFNEGHQIGNHSYQHHWKLDVSSSRKVMEDLIRANQTIETITHKSNMLYRPPFGVTNPSIAKAVKNLQMTTIGWNVRSFDTTQKDPQKLLSKLCKNTKSGSIILLHDHVLATQQILESYIQFLKSKEYAFVTL